MPIQLLMSKQTIYSSKEIDDENESQKISNMSLLILFVFNFVCYCNFNLKVLYQQHESYLLLQTFKLTGQTFSSSMEFQNFFASFCFCSIMQVSNPSSLTPSTHLCFSQTFITLGSKSQCCIGASLSIV